MGAITEVTVSYGMTINLGDFHSARVDAGMTVAVAPGEDARVVYQKAWSDVMEQVDILAVKRVEKRIGREIKL